MTPALRANDETVSRRSLRPVDRLLDARHPAHRSDQPNDDNPGPLVGEFVDPSATMLGDKQEGWLMNALLKSTAAWNVLAAV